MFILKLPEVEMRPVGGGALLSHEQIDDVDI
jgi:hypothetical protein